MGPVQVCNLALTEMGSRVMLTALPDTTTPQGIAATQLYIPKIQALQRGANWDFCRAEIALPLLKSYAGAVPPPQPFLYEYLYPTDCIKARFVLPTAQTTATDGGVPLYGGQTTYPIIPPVSTAIPFVIATDRDSNGNPIKVILTNLANAQLVYTRDLNQFPDMWDPLFLTAATAYLASYFINALARNAQQYGQQVAIAKNAIDSARVANANEAINSADHRPDWMRARSTGSTLWPQQSGYANVGWSWDAVGFPDGQSY